MHPTGGPPAFRRPGAPTTAEMVLAVVVAVSLWPRPVRGQTEEERLIEQLDLQTLLNTPVDVWTPSKTPQKSYQAPSIITTVTREQIAAWGFRSMAELLGHLLGFYVVDDQTSPNVAVRGHSGGLYADSSIIKVLINAHPIAFSPTGGIGLGPELIPLSAIERVEVIRGPASALYGADAFLGMINIQTRQGDAVKGTTAWLALGHVGKEMASDVDVSLGTRRGMAEALVSFRRTDQDLSGLPLPESSPAPNIPAYNRGARTARGLDQRSTSAIATLTLRPRPGRSLGAFAYYSSTDRGSEFGSLFQFAYGFDEQGGFSENRVAHWQLRAGLHASEELSPRLRLALRGTYFQGATRDSNRLEVGSDFYYVRRHVAFRGANLDGHLEWTPGAGLVLAGGVSLFVDNEELPSRIAIAKRPMQGVDRGGVIEAISVRQGDRMFANAGAYLHATWQLYGGRLGLTGGLRYDRHNIYGGQLSRRIGLVGSPWPNVHIKLLHGTAFQAPSPFLLYAVPAASNDVVGNPDLEPQFVNTFDLQIGYQPAPAVTLSTDVAYSLLDDKTEFIQQGINKVARNIARTASLSWESKAELRFQQWINAHLSFEVQRTVLLTEQPGYVGQVVGSQGSVYPRTMVHAGVVGQLGRWPLRAAVVGSYIGSRRASGTNILLNRGAYTLSPYLLLDANIATSGFRILHQHDQEVSFSVSGKNLLGATGPSPGFTGVDYPLAPRAFFVQMNLTL